MRIIFSTDIKKLDDNNSLCVLIINKNNVFWLFKKSFDKTKDNKYIGEYYNNGEYYNSLSYELSELKNCFTEKKLELSCYIISEKDYKFIKTSLALTKDYNNWLRRLKDILEHG